MKRLVIRD